MTKSEYLVHFLISNGITHIFGYPGGYITRFADVLYRNGRIKVHLCYQEQACAFAACAYARLTGNVGVYFTTSGPGVINGLGGIADAYFDGVPLFAIGGNVNTFEMKGDLPVRQLGFQEMDAVSVCKPLTKKAVSVKSSDNFAEVVKDLWQTAQSGRQGPVFLDFPFDIQKENVNFSTEVFPFEDKPAEKYYDEEILNLIKSAEKPIVIAGNGVRTACAVTEIREIAAKIPTVTSMNSVDLITDKRHKIGFIGTYGSRAANILLSQADLVISVGARLDTRQTGMMPKDAVLIRVDIDECELALKKSNQISVKSDAKAFLNFLLESGAEADFTEVNGLKKKYSLCDRELGNLFMEELSRYILPNSVVTADVGQNQVWAAQSLNLNGEDSRILIGGGYGSMGCSLPYSAAAGVIRGRAYCIAGDGGFQMNIQELQTVVREGLPIKIFVFNNSSLGMIRGFQTELFENRFAYTVNSGGYTEPDFCAIAGAYGVKSAKITRPEEFKEYAQWFSDDEACLFNIILGEGTSLTPKILFGTHAY
ncbi:MAG: thiamine pyrophosphate-binding protein [Ruminococcus sp.]|jgi:acetolactate synthase-1/2/3 large subunit|nr:thiamine pyrophosphate-binding protein [Ruminococcus sp.]